MSANAHPACCPACGSEDIRMLLRVESDSWLAPNGDLDVYECRACGEEFDSDDKRIPDDRRTLPLLAPGLSPDLETVP